MNYSLLSQSETLKTDVQGKQPNQYELKNRIYSLLEQYGSISNAEALIKNSKLSLLLEDTEKLAVDTGAKLAELKIETIFTTHASALQSDLSLVQAKVPTKIAGILGADSYMLDKLAAA